MLGDHFDNVRSQALQAATITGTFQVIEDIQVQQYDNTTPIGNPVTYTDVPTIFNFTLTAYTPLPTFAGYAQYSLDNSVLPFNTSDLHEPDFGACSYLTSIFDGIPGQSAHYTAAVVQSAFYHLYNLIAQFYSFDPSGEFIGPNWNGNPSEVEIVGQYTFNQRNSEAIGPITTVTFTTVPEPPSSVLATIAALAMSAVGLKRGRR